MSALQPCLCDYWGWHDDAGVGDEDVSKYSRVYVMVHHHPQSSKDWARKRFDESRNKDDHAWMISLPRVPLALFHVNAWKSASAEPLLAALYHPEAVPIDQQEGIGRNVMQMFEESPSKYGEEVSRTRTGQGFTKLASIGFNCCPERGYDVTTYRTKAKPQEAQVQLFARAVAYASRVVQHARY